MLSSLETETFVPLVLSQSLLENDLVQRCLAACCLEVATCSTRLPSDFPALLRVFRLAPYHFWRVVESVAWTGDSALWEDVRAEGRLPTCQQVVPPSRLEVNADGNPPGGGAARAPPRGSKPLHLFARKVYSLMGRRLRELCSALRIGDELRLQIWTCLEHALVHCTALMRDRHLDQMMMCSIYIMAKITKKEIPFKDIMKCYKSQPHADKGVCKNVLISGDEDKSQTENHNGGGHSSEFLTPNTPSARYPVPSPQQRSDLIHFYNHDYTAKMRDFATLFVPASGGDTPPPPVPVPPAEAVPAQAPAVRQPPRLRDVADRARDAAAPRRRRPELRLQLHSIRAPA
ncbi:retinoblastoma-like protein 2 [Betta splendens]|uniref:Retinoblastoma-like protein 2 n=1 Tax=Betta splendens TaxID=158456 RepID=A0A9W2XPA2_BETSP|nr:retinoblastoma-like protein 2 [Betta splendens]